jgi:hypothetical protein
MEALVSLRFILLSYDIWCQYHVNLYTRIAKTFGTNVADMIKSRIRGAIPKMHVNNHIAACKALYSFNYLPYSGETWGENIEGGWAEQNQTAGSTKEMNEGHRHDTLDTFFDYWNKSKLRQIGECPYSVIEPSNTYYVRLHALSNVHHLR